MFIDYCSILTLQVGDLVAAALESGGQLHDSSRTQEALRQGAGRIRAALLEFRAGDTCGKQKREEGTGSLCSSTQGLFGQEKVTE